MVGTGDVTNGGNIINSVISMYCPPAYCITMTPLIIVSCVNVYIVNVRRKKWWKSLIMSSIYIVSLSCWPTLRKTVCNSVCHLCKVASQQISENILFPASSKYPILAPTRSSKYTILAPTGATPLTQAATIWDFHSTRCWNVCSKSLY